MLLSKIKTITIFLAALATVATSCATQHRSETALRRENQELRRQLDQLAPLQAENARLSNQLAQLRRSMPVMPLQPRAGSNGPAGSPSGTKEEANITYNFPGIPAGQIIDIYGELSGKTLIVDPSANTGQTLRFKTPKPITRSEAMKIIETALIEQAHLVIVQAPGGALSVVPLSAAQR